jgi:hypothetical protein
MKDFQYATQRFVLFLLFLLFSDELSQDDDCGVMKVLATSTDNHPCILYADADDESGR